MAEINIEIDGFWCQKCQDMHPILYWHERYDSYLSNRREQWERTKARFPLWSGDVEYHDNLYQEGLKECEPSECCVCGVQTSFCLIDTNQPVCSNECKHMLVPFIDPYQTYIDESERG